MFRTTFHGGDCVPLLEELHIDTTLPIPKDGQRSPKTWSAKSKKKKKWAAQPKKMFNTLPKDGQHSPKRWSTQSQKIVSTVPIDV